MVWRPTVRYSEHYKDYVDQIYENTTLDRNQILRLALFVAAHDQNFKSILSKNLKTYGQRRHLPHPSWTQENQGLWLNSDYELTHTREKGRGDVKQIFKNTGGIKFTVS